MPSKLRWGILGASKFALTKIVPAMKHCSLCEVAALASRDMEKGRKAAEAGGIPNVFASYEELLADSSIDVIYNPLPNHMHAEWSIKAMQAGKHVLCEKPLTLTVAEVHDMIAARDKAGVVAGEAFMVRTHPQWVRAKEIVDSGEIGVLRSIVGWFSYFNEDPANIRNQAGAGGGGILDIGCYPTFISRYLYGAEPMRVSAAIELDPRFGTDRLSSALLEFPNGHAVFSCSTQLALSQRIIALGTKGRLEVEVPYNTLPARESKLFVDSGASLYGESRREEVVPACDQYTIEADLFSKAVREKSAPPVPLENSLGNMSALTAMLRAAQSNRWETVA